MLTISNNFYKLLHEVWGGGQVYYNTSINSKKGMRPDFHTPTPPKKSPI